MKNSKVMKILLTIVVILTFLMGATKVLAADTYQDITDALNNTSNTNNTANTSNVSNTNNTSNTTNTTNTTNNTLNTNAINSTTDTSNTYNNTVLPKTGIGDSIPAILLIVVFAISAGYAYKKVQDYKNV